VLKDGVKLKNNKLKGDTNIILGGQVSFWKKKNIFLVYLRIFFKILGGHPRRESAPGCKES
jgi:hypothetical protein